MKKLLLSHCALLVVYCSFSQNIGIGTLEPANKLQVAGSLLVTAPTVITTTAPTVAQTKTMVNLSPVSFAAGDSTGRIHDPGGPSGNYIANILAQAFVSGGTNTGIELTIESIDLNTGDSLFIIDPNNTSNILMAVGNGYNTAGKYIFNSAGLNLTFKSNADAFTGTGFSLLFRRMYDNSASLQNVSGYSGTTLFFDVKTGAFRTGRFGRQPFGNYSAAFGLNTIAYGTNSFAAGNQASAYGLNSSALGYGSLAAGDYSFAVGWGATAYGESSVAMGYGSSASGDNSVALSNGDASGASSIAIGGSTFATGNHSFVHGALARADGDYSFAHGYSVFAGGNRSTCFGGSTDASGDYSIAVGNNTTSSGDYSVAMGQNTTASGLNATAMGVNASTNNQINSFCIGGTGTNTVCTSPNQFMTRFDNYTFWISGSNYAYLLPASNGWAYTSDRNKKERFEELDGESVLKKLSNIPFCSWNFKAADTRQYRHYGIAAQDFYNAFGKDSYGNIGNDTTVSPLDLLGVAYSAIKALEKRTAGQQEQNDKAIKENDQLRADNLALQKRLNLLEAKLNELVAIKEKEEGIKKSVAGNE